MSTPLAIVFPLAVVLLTCLRVHHELVNRFVANTRARQSVRHYVARRLASSAAIAFAIFFSHTFIAFLVAFVLWPHIGDPGIDPAGYGLTPEQAALESLGRSSYSFLLIHGDLAFGVGYALWLGAAAAAYSALGVCALMLITHQLLALVAPFLLYIAATLAFALAGAPQYGLLYSLFPGALEACDPLAAASPTLVVHALAVALVTGVIVSAPTNARLS